MTKNAEGLVDVGRLIFRFAKVYRATFHEDGETPESDTDHTVMVSVCACALAEKLYKNELDLGLVAQFAIAHDLLESYADDTDSFSITEAERAKKAEREHNACMRIKEEFSDRYPWIPETILRYERLDTKEARFVKTVDKLMHKITHILNHGSYFKKREMDEEEMWNTYETITRPAEERYGDEFPEILALNRELIEEARNMTYAI